MFKIYDRYEVERQFGSTDWQCMLLSDFRNTLESEVRLFPCIFGVAGFRANQLRFVFADPLDPAELAPSLASYLAEARHFGPNTSLVVITRPEPVRSISAYGKTFWSLLWDLSALDQSPWPRDIPKEVNSQGWEFSFAGEPVFVVCNTPAHIMRQSRRSASFMVTFQPRWVFDSILGSDAAADAAFAKVRARLASYDFIAQSPALGKYGNPETREFAQYFLDEENARAACPYHLLAACQSKVA